MTRTPRTPQHFNGDFHWFLRTRFCRVVAQVVIMALVLVDAPLQLLDDAFAHSTTVFGPEDFIRRNGSPQTVRRTFNVSNPSGPATLCIDNGGPRDQYGFVTSAVVALNGSEVVRPNDFSGRTPSVTKNVSLRSTNQLAVEVRSSPGSGFTLSIVRGTSCPSTGNRPPVARAGADKTVNVGATVQLDGRDSSDPDGHPLTYNWTLITKPTGSTTTLTNPTNARPTIRIDKPGQYLLHLIVNDGQVNSAPDQIMLSTRNVPPRANAGRDQTVRLTEVVQLDGSLSSDRDGDPLTYQWSFVRKPTGSTTTLSSATAVKPTFRVDKAGRYVVELRVSDGRTRREHDDDCDGDDDDHDRREQRATGGYDDDDDDDNDGQCNRSVDRVVITTENSKPVANAGPDQSAALNATITLDGSGSTDVDGNRLTYQWTLTAPAGSTATLSNPTAVKPTFTIDRPGTYTARLIVNDGKVSSDPDTVLISTENTRPVADAGDDQTVARNTTVTLNGSDSSDAEGDTLIYRWTLLAKPTGSTATLSNDTTATPSFTVDQPGDYTVQLIVNDGREDSLPDTVVISTVNSKPVADAGDEQTVTVNTLVQLDGTHSTDADRDPLTYQWSFTSAPQNPAPTLTNATSATPSFTPTVPGLYIVQLIVNDGHEDSAPVTVSITVNPVVGSNNPPSISSTPITTATVGQAYSYDVEATDPDVGDTLTYSLTTTPDGMTINSSTGLIAWTPQANQTGPHDVVVQVSDGKTNGTVTQSFSITVSVAPPVNTPPTITSTPVTTATVGQAYSYDADATDLDAGDMLVYSLTTFPAGMTINASTGLIAWTPQANQTPTQDVIVQVSDGHPGGTATQSFIITVSVVQTNRPPVAQDDQYAVRRGQTLTVPAPGVLQNDSDPDNNPLTAQSVTTPTKGTATLAADGSFTYTPTPPPANSTEPELKFAFGQGTTRTQPLVIDLDKDSVPEIVFRSNEGVSATGNLIALHGDDGSVAFSVNAFQTTANPQIVLDMSSELAAGDIDGDGFPEIIAVDGFDGSNPATDIFRRQLLAFEHDGTYKWTSQDLVDDPLIDTSTGFLKPLIADINGDGTPEIVVGHCSKGPQTPASLTCEEMVTVYDNQGRIVWTARGSGANQGLSPATGTVVAQDINLDGTPEILFGDDVYDNQGNRLWSAATCLTCSPRVFDLAVANLDDDPFAEIVYLDTFAQLYVYEHTGVKKWGPIDVGSLGSGSFLTVGDVDGDGQAEIVLTISGNIKVVSRDGASIRTITVPFSTIFNSPRTTIFDLNSDGKPELIHLGSRGPFDTGIGTGAVQAGAVFIFDGQTGTNLHAIKSTNDGDPRFGPVIADVDGDGSAEIVTGGYNGSPLIHVFKAKNGQWAKARPIYNQFNYSVTNVNSDGTIPARPEINWLTPGLNNYRVNIPLPQERTGDIDQLTYKANDGTLDSNTATVKIDILPPNTAPSILSLAPTTASPNLEYLYAVRAVDPDAGEVLTYALSQAPTGMTINASTGLIRWTPTTAQVGNHVIALKVTDSQNQSAFQGFTITVGAVVTVPSVVGLTQAAAQTAITTAGLTVGTVITSPSATVPAGSVISQEPSAGTGVPSGSAVNLVVSTGPQGVSVPNVVGQTQAAAQTAITSVGLTVGTVTTAPSTTVPAGNVISQTPTAGTTALLGTAVNLVVSVGIITLDGLASIVIEPTTPLTLVGNTQAFTATGIFNDGTGQNLTAIVTWTSSSPSIASIAANGVATGVADGTTTITATVGTISGNTTLTVRAKVPGDLTEPTAAITTPAGGAEVTSPVDVIGTASDANFLKYELAYAPAGETNFTPLSTGTTAVNNGVLGKLDPTLLINDLYDLKLTVYDQGGNIRSATVTVQVEGNQKVGLFTLTFQDLNIPLSGVPITVNRTYDSRDKGKGDFGVGWRLSIQSLRLRTNRILGTGWVRQQSGANISLTPTDQHKVSLTLPDGRVEEFDMVVSPTAGFGSLDFTNVTGFAPRPGTLGRIEALADNALLIVNAGLEDELTDFAGNTYDPQLFRYTMVDGTLVEIHRNEGVKKITDTNGNTLTFGPNGITHSAGQSVAFTRDAEGRITQITDPSGQTQSYAYNSNGDLVTHTDRTAAATRFTYGRNHYLLEIIAANGVRATRNEYDANGRLIATIDPNGNRFEYEHDLGSRLEIQKAPDGTQKVFAYDLRGNVAAEVDEAGNTTRRVYDANDRLLQETNPLNETIAFTYDAQGRETSRTNALGNTTTYTYGTNGQITSVTDPLGNSSSFTLDAKGNRISQRDPAGNTTAFTYNTKGDLLTTTDPRGNVTRYEYDGAGNRTKVINALGHQTLATYNANGTPTRVTVQRTTPSGVQTLTFNVQSDANGKVTAMTDSSGRVSRSEYNALGQLTASIDPAGRRTAILYDSAGRRTGTQLPDGTSLATQYDVKGRAIRLPDRNGLTVGAQYDAVGNLTKLLLPDQTPGDDTDNPTQNLSYDAAKRLRGLTNETGGSLLFDYDASGRINRRSDPVGSTTFTYDAAGRVTAQTDALGRTTTFTLDALGRVTQTTLPDGSTTRTTYDAVGNVTSETDAAGRTTSYEYDALNRLTAVVDASGARTTYTFDELDNLITQRDANGHETRFEYDDRKLRTATIRPGGQRETRSYDTAGRPTSITDFNGNTIQLVYDSLSRLTEKRFPDNSTTRFTYAFPDRVQTMVDARGTTSFSYDVRGRLTSRTEPDGRSISYAYDNANNVTGLTTPAGTVNYARDTAGRISTVTASNGGITSYTYDAANNLTQTVFPNGVTETRTYNVRDFLTQLTTRDTTNNVLTSFQSTYDAAGNQLTVQEQGGRNITYAYDGLARLTSEQITGSTPRSIAYTYDAVSNRLSRTDSVDGVTTYSYDVNDRLLQETLAGNTTTYTYDNNGNRLSQVRSPTDQFQYQWDFDNRLAGVTQTAGATTHATAYAYDAAGTRVSQTVDGVETRYLVDSNRPFAEVVEEYTPAGQLLASYVLGNRRISRHTTTGSEFYHTDVLGSTRALTNSGGAVVSNVAYDAFGRILQQTGNQQPFLFAGEQTDPITNLTYLRARYLDRHTGQFLSTDPFPGFPQQPISLHRYLYANANPVNLTDPSGLETLSNVLITILISATLLALYQGLAATQAPSGLDIEWNGPTVGISLSGKNPFSLGIGFTQLESQGVESHYTKALHLILTVGAATPNPFDKKSVAPTSTIYQKGFVQPLLTILGTALTPLDLQIGDTTLLSPSSFGGETGNDSSVLSGFYVQAGGSFNLGARSLFEKDGKLVNTVGVSGTIQGFGLGYSRPDTPLTLRANAGLSISAGVSIDLTPRESKSQPDARGPQ